MSGKLFFTSKQYQQFSNCFSLPADMLYLFFNCPLNDDILEINQKFLLNCFFFCLKFFLIYLYCKIFGISFYFSVSSCRLDVLSDSCNIQLLLIPWPRGQIGWKQYVDQISVASLILCSVWEGLPFIFMGVRVALTFFRGGVCHLLLDLLLIFYRNFWPSLYVKVFALNFCVVVFALYFFMGFCLSLLCEEFFVLPFCFWENLLFLLMWEVWPSF